MQKTRLGRTNLNVTRTAFGVLPLQRAPIDEAVQILRRAYDAGINFYDTARAYSDSEEKIGAALSDVRDKIIIATKSMAVTKKELLESLDISLEKLNTDYVDILQLHNPASIPNANDPNSSYAGLVEAKDKGKIRFLGITNHSLDRAKEALTSNLFDTLQFPISTISSNEDLEVIDLCKKSDIGLIGMKPLSGGLITKAAPAFAFYRQYENLVPIWGMQRMEELEEIISLDANPPALDKDMQDIIDHDRKELSADFCRACGYCMPCPAGIPIPMAARMSLLLRRMPYEQFLTDEWYEQMHRINDCTNCGNCKNHCPYGLDTPNLLKKMLADYDEFYKEKRK